MISSQPNLGCTQRKVNMLHYCCVRRMFWIEIKGDLLYKYIINMHYIPINAQDRGKRKGGGHQIAINVLKRKGIYSVRPRGLNGVDLKGSQAADKATTLGPINNTHF